MSISLPALLIRSIGIFWAILVVGGCAKSILPNTPGELPGGFIFHRFSREEIFISEQITTSESPMIPTCVSAIGYSGHLIAAIRHPMIRRSPNDPNDPMMIADTSISEYWIIDSKTKKAKGPLSREQYENELALHKIAAIKLRTVFRL